MANTMTFTLAGEDRLTPKFKAAGRAASTFRQTLVGVAGALGAAAIVRGVINFGKESVKAFGEAEDAQKRLQFAFDKFPKMADTTIQALRGLNTELARKTKFDDDNIASGQATLAQFKLTGKQIKDTTPLLLDYASASGKDVPSAAMDVGKALLGNAKALKNIGIFYKSTGNATTDYANITELMRQKVGGFATREGLTAQGRLAILKNQFGELQEEVGARVVPALTTLTATGLNMIRWLQDNSDRITPVWQGLGKIGSTAQTHLVPALKSAGSFIVGTLIPGFIDLTQRGIGQARAAFDQISGAVQRNEPQFRAMGNVVVSLAGWVGNQLSPVISFLGTNALPALGTGISGVVGGIGFLTRQVQEHTTTAKILAGFIIGVFVPHWIALGVAAGVSGIKQVGAWVLSSTAATRAALAHSLAVVKMVGGWVLMGASAVRSGALTVAIWALYGTSAVRAAATHVVAAGRVVGGWVLMGAAATRTGILNGIVWAGMGVAAVKGAAVGFAAGVRVAAGWAMMGLGAIKNAALMAASWLLAMGPVGWVIAGIVAVGAAFVLLWKKSETFRNVTTAVWNTVKTVALGAIRTLTSNFMGFVSAVLNGAAKAFGWVPGVGDKLKGAATEFDKFKNKVNTSLGNITDQQVAITMKYTNTGVNLTAPSSVGRKATGGPIKGPGGGTDDRAGIFALSNDEHVVTAAEVHAAGGHDKIKALRQALLRGRVMGLARGGPASFDLQSKGLDSGALANNAVLAMRELVRKAAAVAAKTAMGAIGGLNWARTQVGKPYLWGGVGPAGYDCSGMVSAVINRAFGRPPHRRLGATGSMPWGMFAPGKGNVMVGWFKGNPGHTAMTVMGTNIESSGGVGVRVGGGARGAASSMFTNRMKVKGLKGGGPAGEGVMGDAPFDLLRDRKLRKALGFKVFDGGGWLMPGEFGYNGTRKPEPVLNTDHDLIDYDKLARALAKHVKDGRPIDVKQEFPTSADPKTAAEAGAARLVSLLGEI